MNLIDIKCPIHQKRLLPSPPKSKISNYYHCNNCSVSYSVSFPTPTTYEDRKDNWYICDEHFTFQNFNLRFFTHESYDKIEVIIYDAKIKSQFKEIVSFYTNRYHKIRTLNQLEKFITSSLILY